ncbi:MAG TPA: MFS transporter [Casimicrobiaceae bacterium]|nr:MFS transporter [Casimicrobiaceae bacterium]
MSARATSFLDHLFASSPLRHPFFRLFYVGTVAAALAYTMQATMAAWLMSTLTTSALMVALVQSASTAPSLLFGLIGGSLADIVDRRRVLLITQAVLLLSSLALAIATLTGFIGPLSLLALTFLVGAGFTFYMPAQQASVNDLVSRQDLSRAIALSSVAFNLARAIGPGLAGAIAAAVSTGTALLVGAAGFLPMMLTALRWKRAPSTLPGVPETLLSGVRSGLRYARHSPLMGALIVRNLSFSICASALWALLPVIARDQLGLDAGGFGLLSAGFGTGAVIGALTIPRHLHRFPLNTVVNAGTLLWVVAVSIVAISRITPVALVGMFGAGAAWVGVLASLSAGTQSAAPAWVRARAVAMNLVAVQASLAIGSALWGWIASVFGISISLAVSAATMLVLLGVNRRFHVRLGSEADVTSGSHLLPDLGLTELPSPTDGPVLIQVEYRVPPESQAGFLAAIDAIGPTRRRNGASDWRVFRDLTEHDRFVERYIIASWAEYERLRSRMTMADRTVQDRVQQFQEPGVAVRVSRLIGIDPHEHRG